MEYPVWEPFLSNSLLIAVIAVTHVFVSHFAIGGGLYLVLVETWARAKNDQGHLDYLQRLSRFFVLITIVFGAVTGVGIWVTIGLIHPTGTKWLINNFVWGWATEWVFFFVEIAAALMYYYGWKRLRPKTHLAIGWIYFAAAWMSLVVINGIITFMLTPGDWLQTGNFWDGFFNPTYLSSLVLRTFICLVLAGLYAGLIVSKEKNIDLKKRIMRRNGWLVTGGIIMAAPAGWWYFREFPPVALQAFMPNSVPTLAFETMMVAGVVLLVLSILGMLVFPRHSGYISAGILLMAALIAMGGFEWTREAIRKPYVIFDFLYSNHITTAEAAELPTEEPLEIEYSSGNRGRDLYLYTCRPCHTKNDYQGLGRSMAGLNEEYIADLIPRLPYFSGKMPPFPGNSNDAEALAGYLIGIAAPDPLETGARLAGSEKGRIAFNRRCGICHTVSGKWRPLADSFEGLAPDDAAEIISMIGDLAESMPEWTGSEYELKLISEYLTGGWQK